MAYCVNGIDVIQRPLGSPDSPSARYEGLKPETVTLEAGFQKSPDHRAFRARTIFDRDIGIPLRDGTVIRGDVLRPAESQAPVPALVAWSPYGKSGTGTTTSMCLIFYSLSIEQVFSR